MVLLFFIKMLQQNCYLKFCLGGMGAVSRERGGIMACGGEVAARVGTGGV